VDYDDDEEYQDDPNGSEDESDDEENYDRMDPNEIADILDDQAQHNDNQQEQANPEEIDNEDSEDEGSENNDNNDDDDDEAAPDPEQDDEEQSHEAPAVTTRSGREVRLPVRFREITNLNTQANQHVEYGFETAKVIARHICAFNEMQQNVAHRHHSFVQQFSLKAGLKKFGQKGHDAAYKEMKQYIREQCSFQSISTHLQKRKKQRLWKASFS
jgi:cobalamin biosynthesis protein CobT